MIPRPWRLLLVVLVCLGLPACGLYQKTVGSLFGGSEEESSPQPAPAQDSAPATPPAPAASSMAAPTPRPASAGDLLAISAEGLAKLKLRAHGGRTPDTDLADAVGLLRRTADRTLALAPLSVSHKTVWPQGTTGHEYVGLEPFAWPDPKRPDGRPYVLREGQVNPERLDLGRFDGLRFERLVAASEALAWGWQFTAEPRYAAKAAELLRVWFLDPATAMRPSLDFVGQIPGRALGRPEGLREVNRLLTLSDAARLLEGAPAVSAELLAGVRGWCSAYVDWLARSELATKAGDPPSGLALWRSVQMAGLGLFAGRPEVTATAVQAGRSQLLALIRPDGVLPQEEAGPQPELATLSALEAAILLARCADQAGMDLWSGDTGQRLGAALDRVLPYLQGQPWPRPRGKAASAATATSEALAAFARPLAMAAARTGNDAYALTAWEAMGMAGGLEYLAVAGFLAERGN